MKPTSTTPATVTPLKIASKRAPNVLVPVPGADYWILMIPRRDESIAVVRIDAQDVARIESFKWYIDTMPSGNIEYPATNAFVNGKRRRVTMHLLLLNRVGVQDRLQVDHKDGPNTGGLDNRRSMLRLVTRSQNRVNSRGQPNRRVSQYKGVSWCAKSHKWRAIVQQVYLGLFDSEEAAARAYDEAAYAIWDSHAWLNFPESLVLPMYFPFGKGVPA